MSSKIPSEWITNCTVSTEIDGNSYTFSLRVNLYGEVLAVKNHFLALPAAARQLMAGNKADAVAERLEQWEAILHFYVPLATLGYLPGAAWAKVNTAVQSLRASIPTAEMPDYTQVIQEEWLSNIHALAATSDGAILLPLLADLLLDKAHLKWYEQAKALSEAGRSLIEPVLHTFIRIEDDFFSLNQLYQNISFFETGTTLHLLLEHLQDSKRLEHHMLLLSELARFEDEKLREQMLSPLLAYFSNAPIGISDQHYAGLLRRFFGSFPQPEVEKFLLKLLSGFRTEPARAAFDILKSFGKTEQVIARSLRYIFFTPRPPVAFIKTGLAVFVKMEDKQSLPHSNELLELFTWNCREQFDPTLIQTIALILKRKLGDSIYSRLSPYLLYHDVNVQRGARLFFSKDGKAEFDVLKGQIETSGPTEIKSALNGIQHLAMVYAAPQLIRPLLKVKEAQADLETPVLLALSTIVKKTPEKVALKALVAGVKNPDPRVRKAIAEALAVYMKGHPEALSAIEALWNDSDEAVKTAARNAYHAGLRTRRKSMKHR